MITFVWLCRFVLLFICLQHVFATHLETGGDDFDDDEKFSHFGERVTREVAMAYFKENKILPEKTIEPNIVSNIISNIESNIQEDDDDDEEDESAYDEKPEGQYKEYAGEKRRKKPGRVNGGNRGNRGPTEDPQEATAQGSKEEGEKNKKDILKRVLDLGEFVKKKLGKKNREEGKKLKTELQNEMSAAEIVVPNKQRKLKEIYLTKDTGATLPGGLFKFYGKLVRTAKKGAYFMWGSIALANSHHVKWNVRIHKPLDSDVFKIFQFDAGEPLTRWVELGRKIGELTKKFNSGYNDNMLRNLQDQLTSYKGKGCFTVDMMQMDFFTETKENYFLDLLSATKVDVIITQAGDGDPKYGLLLAFDDLGSSVAKWVGKDKEYEDNKWLKAIDGTGCAIIVSDETTFLGYTKENSPLCFGDGKSPDADQKVIDAFQTLEAGVYSYITIKLQKLVGVCWHDSRSNEARSDFTETKKEQLESSDTDWKILLSLPFGKMPSMKFLNNATMDVELLFLCLGGLARNAPGYLTDNQVVIDHFSWETDEKKKTIVDFSGFAKPKNGVKWTIPYTNIHLEYLHLAVNNKYPIPNQPMADHPWIYAADVQLKLGKVDDPSDITVNFNHTNGKTVLEITSEKLIIADIILAFNISLDEKSNDLLSRIGVASFYLQTTLSNSDEFDTNKAERSNRNINVIIRGRPIILDFDKLQISAIIQKSGGELKYAIGFYLDGADFSPVINYFLPDSEVSLAWLNELKILFVISQMGATNVKLENVEGSEKRSVITRNSVQQAQRRGETPETRLEETSDTLQFEGLHEKIRGKTVSQGFVFQVVWTIPTNNEKEQKCEGNIVCEWLAEKVAGNDQNALVEIEAKYENIDKSYSFSLSAAIHMEAKLSNVVKFTRLELKFQVSTTELPSLEIEGEMKYDDTLEHSPAIGRELTFIGSIKATIVSLQVTLTMMGFIPIGEYVQFGDMKVSGTFGVGLLSFEFGVTIKFGKITEGNDKIIEIRGDMRLVVIGNPMDNYIYAKISALTVGKVCDAFQLSCEKVPQFLRDTGFPKGVEISWSPSKTAKAKRDIPEIDPGLTVKGTLNIFGMEAYTELSITAGGFKAKLEPGPINWAYGMLQVFRAEAEETLGPIGDILLAPMGRRRRSAGTNQTSAAARSFMDKAEKFMNFHFKFKGFASLFKLIWAKVDIEITATSLELEIAGSILPGLLNGRIALKAGFSGGNDNSPPFSFEVSVDSGPLVHKLNQFLQGVLHAIRVIVQTFLDFLKVVIVAALKIFNLINDNYEDWKRGIEAWEKSLETRRAEIKKKNEPKEHNCPDVCLPFMDWNSKCWKVWGTWVGCPFWNSCFSKIKSPTCMLTYYASLVTTTFKKWAQQALLALESLILKGAKALLELAGKVRDFAKDVKLKAESVNETSYANLPSLFTMSEEDYKTSGINKIIEITEVKVYAKLSSSYKACVGYSYDVTFLDTRYDGKGQACLDIIQFIKDIASAIIGNDEKSKGATTAAETVEESDKSTREVQGSVSEAETENRNAQSKVEEETKQTFQNPDAEKRNDIAYIQRIANGFRHIVLPAHVPTEKEMETERLIKMKIPKYDIRDDPEARSLILESPWKLPNPHVPVGHNRTVQVDNEEVKKRTLDFDSQLSPCARMKRTLNDYSDLTDGLLKYSKSVETSDHDMQGSHKENNQRLERTKINIDALVSKHNVSATDAAEVYHYFDEVTASHNELAKKMKISVETENVHAIPIIRRHLNDLLGREQGSTFLKYTDLMHSHAVQAYKRSQIPNPSNVKGEEILGNIKSELQSIVTTTGSSLTPMTPRLNAVKKNIVAMTKVTKGCRSN